MEICVLASGSSGNCFYIGDKKTKQGVLVDAGISSKQIVERLESIGRKTSSIKGIFITHEHSDHIRGADVFARQFNIPIFATKKTAGSCFLCSDDKLINNIKSNGSVELGGFDIESFSKSHKAVDPVSFSIYGKKKVSIITDLGFCCKNTIKNVSDSDFLCLESNHDINLLENGPYPYYLKQWIRGDVGHLSNMQSSLCVLEHASPKLKYIVLSHLSKTNNSPEIAVHTFNSLIKERRDLSPKILISQREYPTNVINI